MPFETSTITKIWSSKSIKNDHQFNYYTVNASPLLLDNRHWRFVQLLVDLYK